MHLNTPVQIRVDVGDKKLMGRAGRTTRVLDIKMKFPVELDDVFTIAWVCEMRCTQH